MSANKVFLFAAIAVSVLFSGCFKSEAELFGYKGADIKKRKRPAESFFIVGGVTNVLPARVLSVFEKYDFEPAETSLVAAAGIIQPSEPFKTIPAGYEKLFVEPWFVTWAKDSEAFGLKGKCGFVSHYNEDLDTWETGEAFFTSHWKTRDEALAALETIRLALETQYGAKKFYLFENSWAAEYRRLRVMGCVDLNAKGLWSAMLSVQDKNRPGCGIVESVEDQQEMLESYLKAKKEKLEREAAAAAASDVSAPAEAVGL